MRKSILAASGLLAGAALVLTATTASAGTGAPRPQSGETSPGTVSSTKTPQAAPSLTASGYTIVTTSASVGPNSQVGASASCPRTAKKLIGGGVFGADGLEESVNSSYPASSRTWAAYVNNTGASTDNFAVYAVCIAKAKLYQFVADTEDNPSGALTLVDPQCPAGTKSYGGGVFSSSSAPTVAVVNMYPASPNGFAAAVSNGDASDNTATGYAICAKKTAGFTVVEAGGTLPAGTQTNLTAACPSGTKVMGGGIYDALLPGETVNSSTPFADGSGWDTWVNNPGSSDDTFALALAICAATV